MESTVSTLAFISVVSGVHESLAGHPRFSGGIATAGDRPVAAHEMGSGTQPIRQRATSPWVLVQSLSDSSPEGGQLAGIYQPIEFIGMHLAIASRVAADWTEKALLPRFSHPSSWAKPGFLTIVPCLHWHAWVAAA